MKNRKIYYILTIFVFVFTFIIYKGLDEKSYAVDTTSTSVVTQEKYYFIRRNMLSHHYITSNSDPSGTILLKTDGVNSVSGTRVIVYCAHKGKNIAKSRNGKYYVNVPISETSVSNIKNAEDNLTGIMLNSYPYISLSELKTILKTSLGEEEYNKYEFDTLDVQEAMTATQAAIWNAINNTTSNKYRTTKSIGKIKYANFHKGTSNSTWSINWDTTSSYNITSGCYNGSGSNLDCGSKSTFLQTGDTAESAGTYKAKGTTNLEERINRLISWYKTLTKASTSSKTTMPTFEIANYTWNDNSLTFTLKSSNYNSANSYKIIITDLNGNQIKSIDSSIEKELTEFTISDLDTSNISGLNINITATVSSSEGNVYVYEANTSYKNSQYLIGVSSGSVELNKNLQILNDAKGKVKIYKTSSNYTTGVYNNDSYTGVCGTNNNECLANAIFNIYASDKTTVIKELTTSTGVLEVELPLGTYYIQEIEPPVGYELDSNMYEFKIDESNSIVSIVMKNTPNKLCIKKVSTTDKTTILDGAEFSIKSLVGSTYVDFTTSSQEGEYCIEGQLPSGYYYIIEESAPINYFKTYTKYLVKVGNFDKDDIAEEYDYDDSDIVELTLVNNIATIENTPGTVISKSDITTGACVSGATLVIYNEKGVEVERWISSCEDGKDTYVVDLDPGKYTLTEIIAPNGYATSESIEFEILEDGSVNTSLDMKDAPINVCILKTAKGINGGLAGAEFEIYDAKGKLYDTFTSSTSCTSFPYMPIGEYTLKEIKAPDGYNLNKEEIKITVKDTSETQIFEIENEVNVPKTAMDYSKIIIIFASVFMVFGLGLVGYYGYKKRV